MSDIFMSYASQDRPKAQVLAHALEQHGWSVWWDRTIPTGKRFEQVIQEALADARCVMVLWSKQSVTSDWVVEEAEEGRKRHILVPVFIEDVPPPMGFRRIQAADLIGWDGQETSPAFQRLVGDIGAVLGPPAKTKGEAVAVGEAKEAVLQIVDQEKKPASPSAPAPPDVKPPSGPPRLERPAGPSRHLPIRRLLPWFIGVVVLAGGFVAIWVFQEPAQKPARIPRVEPPPTATVEVPSVAGYDQKRAMDVLRKAELRVGKITLQRVEVIEPGVVWDQKPAGGTRVERNTAVDLIVVEESPRPPVSPVATEYAITLVNQTGSTLKPYRWVNRQLVLDGTNTVRTGHKQSIDVKGHNVAYYAEDRPYPSPNGLYVQIGLFEKPARVLVGTWSYRVPPGQESKDPQLQPKRIGDYEHVVKRGGQAPRIHITIVVDPNFRIDLSDVAR